MARGSRRRRYCKRGGLGVSILLAAGWVASLFMTLVLSCGRLQASVYGGGLGGVILMHPISQDFGTGFDLLGRDSIVWVPTVVRTPRGVGPAIAYWAYVPFWCLFPIAVIPTVILWRRDRKIPPGHCQTCGYDLTGNTTGVCSECGTTSDTHVANSDRASAER